MPAFRFYAPPAYNIFTMPRRPSPPKGTTTATPQPRESSTKRGYGWTWQQTIRPFILARDPLCQLCHAYRPGFMPAASTQVDHIVPVASGGTSELTNLQGACAYCNAAKGNRTKGDKPGA